MPPIELLTLGIPRYAYLKTKPSFIKGSASTFDTWVSPHGKGKERERDHKLSFREAES